MNLDNGFIKKNHETVDWDMPLTWWSRPYEYAWVMKRIKENDIVIDAGCGIEHPLKWKMAEKCKFVFGVDSDIRIGLIQTDLTKNIRYLHGSITNICWEDKVDKIVCVSVLEHLTREETLEALECFRDCVKDDGKILLTCDYPTIDPNWIIVEIDKIGLKLDGEISDFDNSADLSELIQGYNLNIFTMVLVKA
jgi:SAM-dependent methyltransferase